MTEMKRIFFLIFAILTITFNSIAQESKEHSSSTIIELEFSQNSENPSIFRTPIHLNIEAYYNAENNTINISYDGEEEGEVFIYKNKNLIAYYPEINISHQLLPHTGLYEIKIINKTWVAKGYLLL